MTRLSLPGALTAACKPEHEKSWKRNDGDNVEVKFERWAWADDPSMGMQSTELQILPHRTESVHPILDMPEARRVSLVWHNSVTDSSIHMAELPTSTPMLQHEPQP